MFSKPIEAHIDQVHSNITHYSVRIVEKVLFSKLIEAHTDQVDYNITHYSVRIVEKVLFSKLKLTQIKCITISHTTV